MRHQHQKLQRGKSTKAERRFAEMLKQRKIPFRTKVLISGREVDFLVGQFAIEVNGHPQDTEKNVVLAQAGYIPIHIPNHAVRDINVTTYHHGS